MSKVAVRKASPAAKSHPPVAEILVEDSPTEAKKIRPAQPELLSLYISGEDDAKKVFLPHALVHTILEHGDDVLNNVLVQSLKPLYFTDSWEETVMSRPWAVNSILLNMPLWNLQSCLETLKGILDKIGHTHESYNNLLHLVGSLDMEHYRIQALRQLDNHTEVSFRDLLAFASLPNILLAEGEEDSSELTVMSTTSAAVRNMMFAQVLVIEGVIYDPQAEMFHEHRFSTIEYEGKKSLSQLGFIHLSPGTALFDKLVARGEKVKDIIKEPSYLAYSGNLVRRSWFGPEYHRANGRIMVDKVSMTKMDPNYGYYIFESDEESPAKDFVNTPEILNVLTPPFLYGYSFTCKRWGEFLVQDVEKIVFRDDALENLVMDKSRKDLIHALVEQGTTTGKDFVSGKSGGLIFLLEGTPGTGKTLTAEAVSECLRRPLFPVSVGQLGTTARGLEDSLSTILAVAERWQAVLLLDEADIFLEKRSTSDVNRNALVSVFLRLLEYYSGVLFLTTNRADNLDPAFFSRVSLALHYPPLDFDDRLLIWKNLLSLYKVEFQQNILEELAEAPLNGREIKNTLRLANALAVREGMNILTTHVRQIMDVSLDFRVDTTTPKLTFWDKVKALFQD